MIFENIKNIIFDLGGVILDIDFNLTVKAFEDIGILNASELFLMPETKKVFDDFEKGLFSATEFRTKIRSYSTKNISDREIDFAWNKLLLNYDKKKIDCLIKLKETHKIFLLSNTNIIHYVDYNENLKHNFGIENLSELFHKTYYSHQIKMRKPDTNMYKLVVDENNILINETLFIDDLLVNIEAAKSIGLQTFHIENNQSFVELFER